MPAACGTRTTRVFMVLLAFRLILSGAFASFNATVVFPCWREYEAVVQGIVIFIGLVTFTIDNEVTLLGYGVSHGNVMRSAFAWVETHESILHFCLWVLVLTVSGFMLCGVVVAG